MPSIRLRSITIDCADPYRLARFWGPLLGFVDHPDDPNHPDDPEALLVDPLGRHPDLLFVPVPEPKRGKNRVHLDLAPLTTQRAGVEHALALGATMVDDRRQPDGTGWAVLADPEGNEFCVVRSPAERLEHGDIRTDVRLADGDRPYPELRTAGETHLLAGLLDWYRQGVLHKAAGLSDAAARTALVDSSITVAGLVKHLALVEDHWFTCMLAGDDVPEPWASAPWDQDSDWDFHSATTESLQSVAALYVEACERSRSVADRHDLDAVGGTVENPVTLRFVMTHLLEETARHLGQLDVLRELLDGTTGQ